MPIPRQNPFDYINKTYNLKAAKGSKVVFKEGSPEEQTGEVTGAEGQYLLIKMNEKKNSQPYHPTWELKILS